MIETINNNISQKYLFINSPADKIISSKNEVKILLDKFDDIKFYQSFF